MSVPRRIWIRIPLALLFLLAVASTFSSLAQSVGDTLEPLAASSRRTGLVISEIMYRPTARTNAPELEFVELFNSQPFPEDISGWRLSGSIDYRFPPGTVLAGTSFLAVAKLPVLLQSQYGITNVAGPYTNSLPNDSGLVRLRNRVGAVLLEVSYGSKAPWPRSPDGTGHSLVLSRPSYGEGDPRAWSASDAIGGSPGQPEPGTPNDPLRTVVINEFLAHSPLPQLDFVELHNRGSLAVDLSGAWLSDTPGTNKYRIPAGTVLPAGGFAVFTESQLGFALSADGESIYLVNSNQTRVIDAVGFRPQGLGVATGRCPDGAPTFRTLQTPSPGAANAPCRLGPIVINEIMYHPLSRNSADEYVELFNRGSNSVSLAGWEISGGIDFTFPANASLPARGYLVVARNMTNLLAHYSQLNSGNTFGNYDGALGNAGDRILLTSPITIVTTNIDQVVTTNVVQVLENEVTYGTGGRWGRWSDAGGSSLELIDAHSDNTLADNWADSDETAKAPWTLVEQVGRLAHGDGTPNALHVLLQGAGQCLVDDFEVIGPTGGNLLANPSFEGGLSPWVPQGNHEGAALLENGGLNNSRCLQISTDGDGDSGANKIRVPLTASLTVNSMATLRAQVRWQRGHPEILLRTAGSYLEAVGRMTVPANLGTPGLPNSRAIANAGPAIHDVRHEPILPSANQPIRVTARLSDPDGLSQAVVRYRIDPSSTLASAQLLDDGSGGDALAGDGVFTATLPGRPAGDLLAFHVEATDWAVPSVARTFPSGAPARECLVRFGETMPSGVFGAYRIWFTQANSNRWTTRLKLNNQPLDATFVFGRNRVIYNTGALYAGSTYHSPRYTSPTGVACDYKLVFPEDDPFLGSDEATIVWPGLTGGDPVDQTGQREVTCYGMAGALDLPFNYQRFVHFFVNGVRRSFIMEDTQKPDGDMLKQWFPDDSNGRLFKVQIWTELNDAGTSTTTTSPATLANFMTDGEKKTSRYRWSWTPRAIGPTANDFSDLFILVDAVNSPASNYTASVEDVVDVEQWMRTFAVEHIVGNWDSYGYGNGQNMFTYKPDEGRWQMMMWDVDVSLGNASDSATTDLFKMTNPFFPTLNGDSTIVGRMYQHPPFARAYWRAIRDAVDGPLLASTANARLDARAAAFAANGVTASSPDTIKTFLSSRRSYCLGRLATVAANFAVTSPNPLTTSNSPVALTGTAPVEIRDIVINGVPVPVTWTSVTSWTARIIVRPGTNQMVLQGLDRLGQELSGMRRTNTVIYTGPDTEPERVVFINEWMASNVNPGGFPEPISGNYEDWFELYNPGAEPVSLAGCGLTDDLAAPFKSVVPAGYTVPANGYLLVWADGQPARNMSNSPQLHVNFQLSKAGEAIGLYAPDGRPIDTVTFGPQTNNVSQGRYSGGGTNIAFLTSPTPGADNAAPIESAPLAFTGIDRGAQGEVVLTWPTTAGRIYRIEFKNNLSDAVWIPLGPDHEATGASLSIVDQLTATTQRFYRIQEVR